MTGRYRKVGCIENYEIVDFLSREGVKYQSDQKSALTKAIDNASESLCKHRTPITSLHEAKGVRNVGPWILKILKVYFDEKNLQSADPEPSSQDAEPSSQDAEPLSRGATGKKVKPARHYCPRKKSAAYALLITLFRAHKSGKEFLKKEELIDETERSGLSEKPIRPKPASWNAGQPNHRDWYSGWNAMKTLNEKGLVLKTSNPAKYRLTSEGTSLAQECISKAGLTEDDSPLNAAMESNQDMSGMDGASSAGGELQETRSVKVNSNKKGRPSGRPVASRGEGVNFSQRLAPESVRPRPPPIVRIDTVEDLDGRASVSLSRNPRGFTTESTLTTIEDDLAVPPLRLGERFGDAFDVICILDRRERFRNRAGSSATCLPQFAEKLAHHYKMNVEVRQIPVGDGLWIARHKQLKHEYVLDFVVERKQVDDLWSSIKDNRYKQQKLRLLNSGLKRLFYLVEGDVNDIESTEALKTAMFTTELQGGFRVLRTTDNADTSRQYGHLTHAIISRYNMEEGRSRSGARICRTYNEFLEHCKALEQERVTDVFCRMLTQIPQITEDIALSIVDKYQTVISLIQDYEKIENGQEAEKMLQGIPIRRTTKTISAALSRKVYQAFWSPHSSAPDLFNV